MTRTIEHPSAPDKDGYQRHPAYGAIRANRISGGTVLFGSNFQHNGFVRISIAQAQLKRDLANDFIYSSHRGFVEVDMSEAQWAHFVSGMNSQATQCTITVREGQQVPGLPDPAPRTRQFADESDERMQIAMRSLDELSKALGELGLSEKKLKPLLSQVHTAQRNINSNREFVAEQFDKHMENEVLAAQQEIDGYLQRVVRDVGERGLALANAAPPVLELPGVKR